MKKIIIIVAIVIVIGIGVYYVFSNSSYKGAPSVSVPAAQSSTAPNTTVSALSAVNVSIKNFSFSPSTPTIKMGAKVTWVNNDNVSHTITSDSGNLLNSETLSPGQSFSFTFTSPGPVGYHCKIHPTMKGVIIVEK